MSRLIDEDAVYEALTDYYHQRTAFQHDALRDALGRVPTADAIKVVRCRDCENNRLCGWLGIFREEYDYCSKAVPLKRPNKNDDMTPVQKAVLENKLSDLRKEYTDAQILKAIDEFIYGDNE